MAYSLSFSESFFYGDPDVPPESLSPSERPTCVYQALLSLSAHDWADMARSVFSVHPDDLCISTVIDRIRETNTCSNLDSPVEVSIEREGWYRILVYDEHPK
jgi:hypothetical protein